MSTMKEESVKLSFQQGSSDKVYHAELKQDGNDYVVNFAYGRRGSALKTGTKTMNPIPYPKAKQVYDKLVNSKIAKGYETNGVSQPIKPVSTKRKTGVQPQLLNEISEEDVAKYIADERYCMQEKNDGERRILIYSGTTVIGSNKLGFETSLEKQVEDDCKMIAGSAILDGEAMGDVIKIFDYLSYPNTAYETRFNMLRELIPAKAQSLKIVETAWSKEDKQHMFDRLKENEAEGVVFKLKDAPYTPGRPNSGGPQLKFKFYKTASCIVASVHSTKSSIGLAVLDAQGNEVNVGNATVYANQKRPDLDDVVEIKYLYAYEGGSLYQPVLLGIRNDVTPSECTIDQLKYKKT